MSSLLVLLMAKSIIAQNTSVCVWGRDSQPSAFVNGEFIFHDIFNGGPSYKKQYGTNTIYLFNCNTKYCISWDELAIDPRAYARCTTSTSPNECDQWQMPDGEGGWQIDPGMSCQMGPCPDWNCDQIITNINYEGCNDTFSIKMGPNVWSNMKQDRFFYFNYVGFNWICNNEIRYDESYDSTGFLAWARQKWIDTSMGNTVNIHFRTPFNTIQEVQCLQNPTNEPSKDPTQPTVAPTYIPTLSPSKPTMNPTLSPSQYPSKNPIVFPTQIPTYDPSTSPSTIPTIQPTEVPSIDPSDNPTIKPTKNPLAIVISTISSTLHSNTVGSERKTTEGVDIGLYIVIIGSTFVCGGVFAYVLLCICMPRFNTQNRTKQTKDELPRPEHKLKSQNNALIPAGNAQKMGNSEMKVIHDANDLRQWLENTVHLAMYYDLFVDSGCETLENVELLMNETHLMEIGIEVKAHRMQILKEIQRLREDGRGYEGQEPEIHDTNNTSDRSAIVEQQVEDDFIIVGDDEITKGNNSTLH
eukprot:243986_1